MSLGALLLTAWTSAGANKLRTSLTLLGIIIGVAAVISLMAVGRGTQEQITARIESLGTDLLFVRPQATSADASGSLTISDALALVDPVFTPSVKAVAPEVSTNATVVFGQESTFVQVLGVTADYPSVRNFTVGSGQFVSPAHVLNGSQIAVLGSQIAETLFGNRDPLGSAISINDRRFTVVGVLESKGGTALGGEDNRVLIPITTAALRLTGGYSSDGDIDVQTINVQADGPATDAAIQEVTTLLRLRHEITDTDDFTVTNQQDTLDTLNETTATFTVFLGAIASISLLVGGIGIMNIMLVSVTERTREIGIRKALGAKRRDILNQFVIEALLLSLSGGAIGVGLGYVLTIVLDGRSLGTQVFNTVFSPDTAVLALVVSAAIGLFFGIYPAARAARLHPIEALRHD